MLLSPTTAAMKSEGQDQSRFPRLSVASSSLDSGTAVEGILTNHPGPRRAVTCADRVSAHLNRLQYQQPVFGLVGLLGLRESAVWLSGPASTATGRRRGQFAPTDAPIEATDVGRHSCFDWVRKSSAETHRFERKRHRSPPHLLAGKNPMPVAFAPVVHCGFRPEAPPRRGLRRLLQSSMLRRAEVNRFRNGVAATRRRGHQRRIRLQPLFLRYSRRSRYPSGTQPTTCEFALGSSPFHSAQGRVGRDRIRFALRPLVFVNRAASRYQAQRQPTNPNLPFTPRPSALK